MLASLRRKLRLSNLGDKKLITIALVLITIIYSLSGVFYPTARQEISAKVIQTVLTEQTKVQAVGFAQGAVYPTTQNPNITDEVRLYGSWLGSDRTTGTALSTWYQATNHFYLLVAGYPSLPSNSLTVEVSTRSGSIQEIALNQQNPGEAWSLRKVSLAQIKQAEKFRIRAIDGTREMQGWLGVSQPFILPSLTLAAIVSIFRVLIATIAAIVIFISPGLICRYALSQVFSFNISFAWVPIPGIAAMCCIGFVSWLSAKFVSPQIIAIICIVPYLVFLLYKSFDWSLAAVTTKLERRAILVFIAVVIVAVAKATYSIGPEGELFGGTISRTLEVGDRSDSVISYHVVQLIAHATDPYSKLGTSYFAPWSFSHRGPLAGFAASPVVFLSGARVPTSMPFQPWAPFDPEGFSAYRIAMIIMAAASLLVLFGLAKQIVGERWGFMTLLVAATTPFIVHEVYFTWPKLQAGMFVLLAASQIVRQKFVLSGMAVGIGYLFHPSALISVPPLICIAILKRFKLLFEKSASDQFYQEIGKLLLSILKFLASAIAFLFLWRLINSNNYVQNDFFNYVFQANTDQTPSFTQWTTSRVDSFLNTVIPLHLFIFHGANPSVNSFYGESPNIIRFFFQYWNTLPFGIGIIYFFPLVSLLLIGAIKLPYIFATIIALPLVSFTIYWGAATTGMLREGLHVWIFFIVIFASLVFRKHCLHKHLFWKYYNISLALRGVEIFAMLVAPTWASKLAVIDGRFSLNDTIMLLLMLSGILWLSFQTYFYGEELRKSYM